MPYIKKTSSNGQELKILVDTGTAKNYISNLAFIKFTNIKKPFHVNSIDAKTLISKSCKINVLGITSTFYLLPQLQTFHGIIGFDFLKKIRGTLDFNKNVLKHARGIEKLNHFRCSQTNLIDFDKSSIPSDLIKPFEAMVNRNSDAFAQPDRALPYNTSVKATIRTNSNDPIYTKSYPYPISATDFIQNEIQALLRDGVIQRSCSPYNSPVHVVTKKGLDDTGKQKLRMVIDFRKINEKTVADRYPIPDTSVILANLGKSKYFTTLDLKSGFHQIVLKESDRQKTAFNINNGKYEFRRLPFGLKNAPSIFQRAIDDVLRDFIGKFCHVYIDDIIIFSVDEQSHLSHIEQVLRKLHDAGMRVSQEKSKFFKEEVEFLGFTVSSSGIKTNPSKVEDILNFQVPESLRALRSFLGLSGYYRRFIKDYASIVKPLTKYLRGENGNIGTQSSKKVKISLDCEALLAFNKVKSILASEDVLLQYPDYSKSFELTTDASASALGAVLSQDGRPITMISRTLSKTEENYATNERELLAIVWALQSLRHYLYGIKDINIFTDHQPLIYSISDKNPNTKMKRWRAFIEEYSPSFYYKPGKENVVADALSRQFVNHVSSESYSTIHSEHSSSHFIKTVKYPVNQFRNQLILSKSNSTNKTSRTFFKIYSKHLINFSSIESLLTILKNIVNSNVTNALCCDLPTLAEVQNPILTHFPGIKFIHTEKCVIDVTDESDQIELMTSEHHRAHRNAKENFHQIISEYFFPNIKRKLTSLIINCKICRENKYQRNPPKTEIGKTPIPNYPGEILHMDIFTTDKQHFLTCIDKFSKFAVVQPIASRAIIDIRTALLLIMGTFQNTRIIASDNEKAFKSNSIQSLLRDNYNVEQFFVPTLHSESNGQIERFHSTLLEIARCTHQQQQIENTIDLIILSTSKYNNSFHSVVESKPINALQSHSQEELDSIKSKLIKAQENMLQRFNRNAETRNYEPGEKVFLKKNKRLGNKFHKIYVEKIIERDLGTTVLIDGIKIHKDNLRE